METILAIEDSTLVRTQLQDILGGHYRLILCEDGETGIAKAARTGPALILLDIYLPGLDGYEICRRLKTDAALREIPVLFITSLQSEAEKVRGFEAGADDYIVKPFYAGELLARIRLHLASRRERQLALELERLKLLQEMAVALSHEINNPLTTAFGRLHLLERERDAKNGIAGEHLAEIRTALEGIEVILKRLARASRLARTDYVGDQQMLDLDGI
jgi:DNA-binding response OmpR family regulator